MKKISFLLLAVLLILFFNSCNSGGSGKAYTIKMRLNKGDKFTHHIKTNMEMNSMMKTSAEVINLFEVIKSDSEEKEIKLTYRKLDQKIDMDALKTMHQKRDSALSKRTDSLLNKMRSDTSAKSITIKLNRDNQVTSVSGIDSIMNNSLMDSARKQMMAKMFSKDQFNNMFKTMFDMYPKKAVRVGDSWSSDATMSMGPLEMKINNKYTLISVKNGIAEIAIDGTVNGDGTMNKNMKGLKMDMSGEEKGTYTIKMETGYLQTGNYKMDFKMVGEMSGKKILMTMKGDYSMKAE